MASRPTKHVALPDSLRKPFAAPVTLRDPANHLAFDLLERYAYGGTAEVFLACPHGAPREGATPLALKRLYPHLAHHERARAAFDDEIAVLRAGLTAFPPYVAHGIDEVGIPFLVEHFVVGCDLATLIRAVAAPAATPSQEQHRAALAALTLVVARAAQLAGNLALADGTPLAHRDLSAGNVLIALDGSVSLADPGIAHFVGRTSATETGVVRGTLSVIAPERARAEKLATHDDELRAETFALAALLVHAVTGEPLYEGEPDTLAAAARGPDLARLSKKLRERLPADVCDALDPVFAVGLAHEAKTRPLPPHFSPTLSPLLPVFSSGEIAEKTLANLVESAASPLLARLATYRFHSTISDDDVAKAKRQRRARWLIVAVHVATIFAAFFSQCRD